MTDWRTLQQLENAPFHGDDPRYVTTPIRFDGTELWSTWGGQKTWTVGVAGAPVPSTQEVEIARLEAPSPRAIRLTLQLDAAAGVDVIFRIITGIGRITLTRTVNLTGPTSTDIEVAARMVYVHVELDEAVINEPVIASAVIAPVVPWFDFQHAACPACGYR